MDRITMIYLPYFGNVRSNNAHAKIESSNKSITAVTDDSTAFVINETNIDGVISICRQSVMCAELLSHSRLGFPFFCYSNLQFKFLHGPFLFDRYL